jgi:hypothetical protein
MRTSRVVWTVSAACVVCGMLVMTTTASAQTRPNGGNAYQPAPAPNGAPGATPPVQPGAPNGDTSAPPPPPPDMISGGYQPSSYYPEVYHYNTGWPGVEVRAFPGALTRRAIARAEYRRLQTGLDVMIRSMRNAFERTRDYVGAIAEEREAFEQLERERNEALRSVRDDPSYQASVSLKQNLTDQIVAARDPRRPYDSEVMAMAQVKMGYASTASAMEAAALSADPDVQQARERLRRASARVSELRAQRDLEVRNSPELEVARRNLADARIAKLAAEVNFQGVKEVANIALDYARFTHRYDQYQYLSYGHYGYFGYPYSAGYPYNWRY